jgi:hypothetical protein
MNLLNVYIVLAYYKTARKNTSPRQKERHKLTGQGLDTGEVREQIEEIVRYRQSALHWNRTLFETKFTRLYGKALDCYEEIERKTGVIIHAREPQQAYLAKIEKKYSQFQDISLKGSQGAAQREIGTTHKHEHLGTEDKASFSIENYLGGVYHLTADEIIVEKDVCHIQESKNTTSGRLPGLSDIKDGLFKLILYSNLDRLFLDGVEVSFSTRLKLTGAKVVGKLMFPCSEEELSRFLETNRLSARSTTALNLTRLQQEAASNKKLTIEIGGHW